MIVFLKAPKVQHIGKIIAGLGVLFIGMDMMGSAMLPLQESESFISLMTKFSNPVLGILAGAVHIDLLRQEIERMITLAGDNVEKCYKAVLNSDSSLMKKVLETEETIDALNKEISQYISKILVNNCIMCYITFLCLI